MNKLTYLKKALDIAIGQGVDPAHSSFKIVGRDFQAGAHIIQIEYVYRANDLPVTPSKKSKTKKGRLFDEITKSARTRKRK